MRHLSFVEIIEMINGGNDGGRDHLKECGLCLKRSISLAEFASSAKSVTYIDDSRSEECLSYDDIADIIDGADKNEAGRDHIAKCDTCFGNAAYYFSQSNAMESETERLGGMVPKRYISAAKGIVPSAPSTPKELSWLDRWVFAPFPAYATAALLLLTIWTAPAGMTIAEVSGGDSYTVYQKTDSGIPYLFFGDTGKISKKVEASMVAAPMKREMHFSWSKMPDVKEYFFVLQDITDVAPRTVVQLSTKKSFVRIPWKQIKEGKRYRWITAGGLSQESYFRGEARFVAVKK